MTLIVANPGRMAQDDWLAPASDGSCSVMRSKTPKKMSDTPPNPANVAKNPKIQRCLCDMVSRQASVSVWR